MKTSTLARTNGSEKALEEIPLSPGPLATAPAEVPISAILAAAVEKGMDPAGLQKIADLYVMLEGRKAAQEFAAAMAAFQDECPPISKTSSANITTRSGPTYSYSYAELDQIARTVRPALHKHGLSYSWDSDQASGLLTVTCIIRHKNGHQAQAKFVCPIDSAAAMSAPQKVASALTYARRQSLIQALGLSTCDPDDDAGGAGTTITEHQAANLQALMDEVNADAKKFLHYLGVGRIRDLPASRYYQAVQALERKRSAR